MKSLSDALLEGATSEEIERSPVPADYLAAYLLAADSDMVSGVADKDVRKSLRVGRVPMPALAPDEVLVRSRIGADRLNPLRGFSPCLGQE
jgi:crotonyl-CoA reductase